MTRHTTTCSPSAGWHKNCSLAGGLAGLAGLGPQSAIATISLSDPKPVNLSSLSSQIVEWHNGAREA